MGAFRSTPLRTALVLVASVLLLAASLSLLAVTAHAWLSDTVTNENNTITTADVFTVNVLDGSAAQVPANAGGEGSASGSPPNAEAPGADPSGDGVDSPPEEESPDVEPPADEPSSGDLVEDAPAKGDGVHEPGVADAEPASGAIAGSQEAEAER